MNAQEKPDPILVLVAEDEQDTRDLITFHLERAGCRVLVASNGREALELAIERHPDVAVLDVMMPRMHGLELVRRIREHAEIRGTPIILLTAADRVAAIQMGYDVGADSYILKPFEADELLDRLDELTSGRPEGRARE